MGRAVGSGPGRAVRRLAHPLRAARRLVSGAGDIKLTKDGNVLLQEMVSDGRRGARGCGACLWMSL